MASRPGKCRRLECVSCQGVEEQREDRHTAGKYKGVQKVARERYPSPNVHISVEGKGAWKQVRRVRYHVIFVFERGKYHPDKREEDDECRNDQDYVDDHASQGNAMLCVRCSPGACWMQGEIVVSHRKFLYSSSPKRSTRS